MDSLHFDVAVVGGGPGGSTFATILRKYAPNLSVLVLERETFPRDHVGESGLPPICRVLEEMGCWDKIEAANFPIKIGATYKWGKRKELWDFEFFPGAMFQDESQPAKYEGQCEVVRILKVASTMPELVAEMKAGLAAHPGE